MFGNEEDKKQIEAQAPSETTDVVYMDQLQGVDPAEEMAVLYQLGQDKERGTLQATWDEIAAMMNELFRGGQKQETESSWRKKYARLRDSILEGEVEVPTKDDADNVIDFAPMRSIIRDFEKERMRQRDERMAYTRELRSQSRQDAILDLFRETIQRFPQSEPPKAPKDVRRPKAVYAMLSDIHYGLTFSSYVGTYNSDIAKARVMRYADEIVLAGKREKASVCFVSLMGDMISGIIHPTIRIENKENAIEQVVGVSELVATFLYYLAGHFEQVFVNSVDGNHSRLDENLENSLRKEKLDALIPWYCKAKLAKQENIVFADASFDATVATYEIGRKLFVAVHGDMEKDLKTTANALEKVMGRHIDYLLAGHMHVPEMRAEDTMYVRNGSVCGSGDEYTMKKRLFCPPYQVFMILNDIGEVESIHTVNLSDADEGVEKAVAI